MRMKKYVIIVMVLLVILSISIVCILFHKNITMNVKLNTIINQYGNITSRCEIVSKEEAAVYINSSNANRNKFENSADDKSFIKINLNPQKGKHNEPNEILSIMDVYLFAKEQEVADNISGFICCYQSGKSVDLNSINVVLSMTELNELFDECKLYSKKVDAQEMSVKWIKDNYYFRDGLEMNLKYSKLLSEWNRYITSNDSNFELGYIYDDNRLKVLKLEYDKYENIDIVTTKTAWTENIDEEGVVYAAWDNNNNIWLLGETLGLKLFRFNGKDGWLMADEYSDFTIPNILNDITFR